MSTGHTKEFSEAGGGRSAVVLPGPEVTVQKGFRAGCMSSRRAELYSFLASIRHWNKKDRSVRMH